MTADLELPEGSQPESPQWLDHLNAVYAQEYSLLTLAVSIGTVGGGVVATLLLRLPPVCQGSAKPPTGCITSNQLLIFPLGPMLVILFFGYLFLAARVVGKYARNLERIISGANKSALQAHDVGGQTLKMPALARLEGAMYGGETRRLIPLRMYYQTLAAIIVGISVLSIGKLLIQIPSRVERYGGFAFYGTLGLFVIICYRIGASHATFPSIVKGALKRDISKFSPNPAVAPYEPWLGFVGFLLIPRVLSLLKASDAFIALLVVAVATWGTIPWSHWLNALIGVAIFECVLYQTRYLLNMVREDQQSGLTLPADRRNLPGHPLSPVQQVVGAGVSVVRVFAFVVLFVRYTNESLAVAATIVAAFFIAYYSYELPREKARLDLRQLSSGSGSLPSLSQLLYRGRGLYVAVGLGYAVRVATTLYLLSPEFLRTAGGVALCLLTWLLGSARVGVGWAIEFKGALASGRAAVVRESGAVQRGTMHENVFAKPNLIWAGRHAGLIPTNPRYGRFTARESQEGEDVDLGAVASSSSAPWHVFGVSASWLGSMVIVNGGSIVCDLITLIPLGLICVAIVARKGTYSPGLVSSVAAIAGAVATHFVAWHLVAGALLAALWPVWQIRTSGVTRLQRLVETAIHARAFLSYIPRIASAVIRWVLEIAFGSQVASRIWP